MRISRGCYDKFHRCPGWAGGGLKYARGGRHQSSYCNNGRLVDPYEGKFWKIRVQRCNTCEVRVLPYLTRWIDPSWVSCEMKSKLRNMGYLIEDKVSQIRS